MENKYYKFDYKIDNLKIGVNLSFCTCIMNKYSSKIVDVFMYVWLISNS